MNLAVLTKGYRPLVALAAPIAGIQLAQVALTTTDLAMMGLLGVRAVAAGGLSITLYNQLRTMCVGMVTSVGNQVAGAVGRAEARTGDGGLDESGREEVRRILRASFLVATGVGLVAALALAGLSFALTWFGQPPEVLAMARPMMIALAPGLIPMLWLNVVRQFAVGLHRPGSLLGITIVSIGVNAGLDAVFIYGLFGLPVLGLTGVGLATSFVQLLTFLAFLALVRRDRQLRPLLSVNAWQADLDTVKSVLRLGFPISLTYGSEAGITSVATLMMGAFGPVTLAAHNVVNQCAYIVYQLNIGLSQGSSISISRAVGKGDRAGAGEVARRALTLGPAIMTVIGLVYVIAPAPVLKVFLGGDADAGVLAAASTLLLFAILQQYCKGTQNIGVGLLRGLGDTKAGFRMTLIGYWLIGTPVMVVCGYVLGLHGPGIWIGLCAGFGATAVLLLRRFRRQLRPEPDLSNVRMLR
ncbi:MATE family efflux transporter [Amycolatopsis jiangsuensis]|uniref:Probable multidrug resistance protein NorM n=1 Tax=Amycolatopsis jiangsuensis TaxID=1181879 RepID=A0A840J5L9_9PSEU|nr:MATE family efflux transporter [Amycolatopsis jiangsuensis]MBB4688694.1 MATE family multidrug resistance protein [Amycolatopsis jiangsuensis]